MPERDSKAQGHFTWRFMKEVFRTTKTTGAVGPSSMALAEEVTERAQLQRADVIVEFGSGTGVFTEVIERKKKPGAYFLALDVNPEFVTATRERCPQVHVVEGSAEDTAKFLREAGYDHCDVIVSGLPWTLFPEELQDRILGAAHDVLGPGGRFVTFAYTLSPLFHSGKRFFKGKLPAKFPRVTRSGAIWKNFPPAHVYIADKD
ncbi:MAG: methyltransferase domain-containing protein [Candidatus Hydrogenedentes bacterium]|nr:methyltransferase domain-containing protein [Candidatus Hydrogenedentota bacterium]